MKETKFQRVVTQALKSLDNGHAQVLNVHGHPMQASGWPDLYVACSRWRGWLELKVGGSHPTKLQELRMWHLRSFGVPAYVLAHRDGGVWVEYDANDGHRYCVEVLGEWYDGKCLTSALREADGIVGLR